jgi:light-regulated signal transduction histidine kinase (bacteriophytochrome)
MLATSQISPWIPQAGIQCVREADYQVLIVSDNNLDVEEKHLRKLFTMFRRFHNYLECSGISVYMVKKMIENVRR